MNIYEQFINGFARTIVNGAGIQDTTKQEIITYGLNILVSFTITTLLLATLGTTNLKCLIHY